MRIGLVDVDGHNYPNLPLMKLSAWHKSRGDHVEWYSPIISGHMDRVYLSKVFTFTPDYEAMIDAGEVIRGGSGYCITLEAGKQHWYCVYCLRPDIWEEAKAAEETIGYSIIKGVYLKELEPKFQEMRDVLRIVPTDKTNSARFWKEVREAMPEEQLEIPCDCSF